MRSGLGPQSWWQWLPGLARSLRRFLTRGSADDVHGEVRIRMKASTFAWKLHKLPKQRCSKALHLLYSTARKAQ